MEGHEEFSNLESRTQVYLDTHKGDGKRLPFMFRSFISFSYGGKIIEDFGVIVVNGNNFLNQNLYAQFEDMTTSYEVLDGQFFWGSHFTTNQISLTLATDGMTENQLNDFKRWFKPGKAKELILAEHPNRAIMARISDVPTLSMIPFEKEISVKIGGNNYNTSTTLYKGTIELNFVMDDPFWYSRTDILGDALSNYDTWTDANGESINYFSDPDVMKIVYEDGVPVKEMIKVNCFVGGGKEVTSTSPNDYYSSEIGEATVPYVNKYNAIVGPIVQENNNGENLTIDKPLHLYYCGTAPGNTILNFTMTPELDENGYINVPYNLETINSESKIKNYIGIKNKSTQEINYFYFTTPSIYGGYNNALKIINSFHVGEAYTDIYVALTEGVKEYYSRAWAVAALNMLSKDTNYITSAGAITSSGIKKFLELMKFFICDRNGKIFPASFSFDSKTGEAIGLIKCRIVIDGMNAKSISDETIKIIEENVGDMVKSPYLIIDDRCAPNSEGYITENECLELITDYPTGLENIKIVYNYMYY